MRQPLICPKFAGCEQVGQRLERVGLVAQHVDHRYRADSGHAFHHGVVEHPGADGRVVTGQGAGNVLGGLPLIDAHLSPGDGHRVAAELHHGHLHGVPGAG